jgi:hypothetical protein
MSASQLCRSSNLLLPAAKQKMIPYPLYGEVGAVSAVDSC